MSSRFLGPREFLSRFLDSQSRELVHHRDPKRTLENLLAGDVKLSTEDWAEIAQLLGKSSRKSAR